MNNVTDLVLPDTDLKAIEDESSLLLKQADSYIIQSTQDVDLASEFLRKLKDAENMIEAKRLEFTAPINKSLKAINETFKKLSRPLKEARESLSGRILDWRRAENDRLAKEEERRRKIQEAHERAGHEVKAPIVLERPEAKIGNTQIRKDWTYEVIDFSKIEDRFKIENAVAINQAIRDGLRDAPGLRIYQKETLSIIRR